MRQRRPVIAGRREFDGNGFGRVTRKVGFRHGSAVLSPTSLPAADIQSRSGFFSGSHCADALRSLAGEEGAQQDPRPDPKSRNARLRAFAPAPSAQNRRCSLIRQYLHAVFLARARRALYLNTLLMIEAKKITAAIRSNPPMIFLFRVPLRC